MNKAFIIGTGMALASNEVTNQTLCDMFPMLATSDEWVRKNVGIRKRYICGEGEDLAGILARAGAEAIEQSGVKKIDRIIVGSNTQARHFPATASLVAQELKDQVDLSKCWCVDIQNGCPAGLAAMALGVDSIRTGQAETVLIVGGDTPSRMVDWFDRNTCLLLGDAASAYVLSNKGDVENAEMMLEVLSHFEQTDFDSSEIMVMESGTADFTPFQISDKIRDAARDLVRRVTGEEVIPTTLTEEQEKDLKEGTEELRKLAFPGSGNMPYEEDRNPYFVMQGAEVLEKIRRIVPDCGYLTALRDAGLGLDIFEKYDLLETHKVSDIPADVKKAVLTELALRYNLFIPHQANMRGHQNLSAAFKIPMTRLYSNIADYANTSAAAAGLALYEALRKPARYRTIRGSREEIEVPMLSKDQTAVLVSFGSGTSVVFVVVRRLK